MTNIAIEAMAIEIVDLPMNSMVIFQFAMLNYQRVCIIIGFWSILTSKHSWSVKHFHCQYSPMVPPSSVPPNAQKKHQLHPASSNHPTTKPHLWTFEIKKRHRFRNFQPHSIHDNPTKNILKTNPYPRPPVSAWTLGCWPSTPTMSTVKRGAWNRSTASKASSPCCGVKVLSPSAGALLARAGNAAVMPTWSQAESLGGCRGGKWGRLQSGMETNVKHFSTILNPNGSFNAPRNATQPISSIFRRAAVCAASFVQSASRARALAL